jgi:hypothetical protein
MLVTLIRQDWLLTIQCSEAENAEYSSSSSNSSAGGYKSQGSASTDDKDREDEDEETTPVEKGKEGKGKREAAVDIGLEDVDLSNLDQAVVNALKLVEIWGAFVEVFRSRKSKESRRQVEIKGMKES